MSKKTRNRFSAPEKVAILRLHLLEHTPVSDLCDQHGIHPTMFYRWQKEFFENAAAAFEHRSRRPSDDKDRQGQRTPKTNTGWSKCRFPEQLQVISDCALLHFDCFSDNAGHTMYY